MTWLDRRVSSVTAQKEFPWVQRQFAEHSGHLTCFHVVYLEANKRNYTIIFKKLFLFFLNNLEPG